MCVGERFAVQRLNIFVSVMNISGNSHSIQTKLTHTTALLNETLSYASY